MCNLSLKSNLIQYGSRHYMEFIPPKSPKVYFGSGCAVQYEYVQCSLSLVHDTEHNFKF